ncbi:MAG: hypothetical protein ACJA06_001488 [Halocynthiibacter sp.]
MPRRANFKEFKVSERRILKIYMKKRRDFGMALGQALGQALAG